MFEQSEFEKLPILRAFCSALGGESFGAFLRLEKHKIILINDARGWNLALAGVLVVVRY